MSKNATTVKKRNWAFVLYPESAPADWVEQLKQSGLPCAISPLHDKDLNPDGEPKKAHHHIILIYGSPTTFNNVKALTERLNQPIPQPLEQVRGYYRYLTHKDNPEKAQYDERYIECLNGFCISDFVEMTKSEVLRFKRDIQRFIRDNDILEYCDLMDTLEGSESLSEWYDVASCNTYFFEKYISSRRNKARQLKGVAE